MHHPRNFGILLCAGSLVLAACGSSTTTGTKATATTAAGTTTTAAMDHSSGHDHGMDHGATGGHHHDDSTITYAQLTGETKQQVDAVIKWASKWKTGADAKKDGWVKATRSLYGIGSHWLRGGVASFASFGETPNIAEPNVLLFDGEGDDAKLAGISIIVNSPKDPEGFAGSDDHWHRHNAICFVNGLVISEGNAEGSPINLSKEQCKAKGGFEIPIGNLSMMHLWIGDDYINAGPIFAHDHPMLLDGYRPADDKS